MIKTKGKHVARRTLGDCPWLPGPSRRRLEANRMHRKASVRVVLSVMIAAMSSCVIVGCLAPTPEQKALRRLSQWGATDWDGRSLIIPFESSGLAVVIRVDDESGLLEQVDVTKGKHGPMFTYQVHGTFGVPESHYSAGKRLENTWMDLNSDGRFDVLVDAEFSAYIHLDEGWTKGLARKGLEHGFVTENGQKYLFDIDSGKWVEAPAEE